jgi:S-adenosylmethionine decarboxylase
MKYLGKQIILELYGCPHDLLCDPALISKVMNEAAEAMEATIVTSTFHHFSPLGVSGVVVIMESHLTIHTWPEYGYAAIDIFTCGEIQMKKGVMYLEEKLGAKRKEMKALERGINLKHGDS